MLKGKNRCFFSSLAFAMVLLSINAANLIAKEITFQNGLNGYNGTSDTYINGGGAASKNYNYGASEKLEVVGIPWTGAKKSALARFEDVIGDGENQVPAHAQINSVRFELYQFDTEYISGSYSVNVQRMLVPWSAGNSDGAVEEGAVSYAYRVHSATSPVLWGSADGASGPQRSGVDYESMNPTGGPNYNATSRPLVVQVNWLSFDMTDMFRLWASGGSPNYGVIITSGTSYMGPIFRSSEYAEDPSLRPRLIVDYTAVDKDTSEISASHVQMPAGGANYPVSITVRVVDESGNPLSNIKTNLVKSEGPDVNIEAKNGGVTDNEGLAVFTITSVNAGLLKFYPTVEHGELGIVTLEKKECSLNFTQIVDAGNSDLFVSSDEISADGVSKQLITVKLNDNGRSPVAGRTVTLSTSIPEKIKIIDNEIITNEQGEAIFELTTTISSLEPIYGNLTAQVVPDLETEEPIIFSKGIKFVGRLLTKADGKDDYSRFEIGRKLAMGLEEEHIGANLIPTDGISCWEIIVKLVDNSGTASNRKVRVVEQGALELSDEELYPQEQTSDINGEARFYLKTQRDISEINLKIEVPNDANCMWLERFGFISAENILYVTDVLPAISSPDFDVTQDFEIIFNNDVKLVSGETSIRLIPLLGKGKETQDTYGGLDDSAWFAVGNKIIWKHERLSLNTQYEARLKGVALEKDPSIKMKVFIWQFMGEDVTCPSVSAVEPSPWAVEISTEPILKIVFSEPLLIDEKTGFPLRLLLKIKDSNNNVLPDERITLLSYDENTYTVEYKLSIDAGITYTSSIYGVMDYAELEMIPFSWSFSTISTGSPILTKVEYQTNTYGDVIVNSPIKLFFNKEIIQLPIPEIVISDDLNNKIPGEVQFISGLEGIALMFTPTVEFEYDTVYKITINNVFDTNGNAYIGEDLLLLTEVRSSAALPIEDGQTHAFEIKQNDGEYLTIEVTIPEGAVPFDSIMEVFTVHLNRYEEFDTGKYNPNLALTPSIFEFRIKGNKLSKLKKPMTIKIPYADIMNSADGTGEVLDISGNRILEKSLKAYYWEELKNEWLPIGGTVDYVDDCMILSTDLLGTFALIGSNVEKDKLLSEVRITTNPLSINEFAERKYTTFKFATAYGSLVTITLFETNGRMIGNILKDEPFTSGYNGFIWDGTIDGVSLKPGIYIYRLSVISTLPSHDEKTWVSGVIGVTR